MKKNNSEAIELAKIYHKWIEYSTIANSQHTVRTYEFSFRLYIEFLEEQKEISTSSFCMAGSFSISTIKEWLRPRDLSSQLMVTEVARRERQLQRRELKQGEDWELRNLRQLSKSQSR